MRNRLCLGSPYSSPLSWRVSLASESQSLNDLSDIDATPSSLIAFVESLSLYLDINAVSNP